MTESRIKVFRKTELKYIKGSFTIECALIMPVILLCIVSIIWMMIYMYDENVV